MWIPMVCGPGALSLHEREVGDSGTGGTLLSARSEIHKEKKKEKPGSSFGRR